jgi:hypothetical protein
MGYTSRMNIGAKRLAVMLLALSAACYAQNSHPGLKDTLQWMHSAFPDSQSETAVRFGQTRELNFSEGRGDTNPSCTVTIVDHWKSDDGKPVTRDTVIDLSLIDPQSIKWYKDDISEKNVGTLMMVATDDKKIIVEKMEGKEPDKNPYLNARLFLSFIGPEYAERFAKAFKNAVTLCGGKVSVF